MAVRIPQRGLAFSSLWLGSEGGYGQTLLGAARALDLHHVKIGPELNAESPVDLAMLFKEEKIKVVAMQTAFTSQGGKSEYLHGDTLCDAREAEVEISFNMVRQTAWAAKKLGTKKVVIRLGKVKDDRLDEIQALCEKGYKKDGLTKEIKDLVKEGQAIVEKHREAYTDRLIRTLHALLQVETDAIFCIENGYAIGDLPDLTALTYILEDLKAPKLGFWHNAGNAQVQECLGLVEKGAWIGEHAEVTQGTNLSDASGIDRHLPPGAGAIDYKLLLEELPNEAAKVLDLKPESSLEEYRMGIQELRDKGV
jgi:hypothetical protein